MSSEPIHITLLKEGDFDGITVMNFVRTDFTNSANRIFTKNFGGAAGLIPGNFFGIFAELSPKVISVAGLTYNPSNRVRVQSSAGAIRREVHLTPAPQYMLMYPGDNLALLTMDGGRAQVDISVNELSEAEAVSAGLLRGCVSFVQRLRIIRTSAFVPAETGPAWQPVFQWDASSNLLVATDHGQGPLPVQNLTLAPRFDAAYISVRFSGMAAGAGKLYVVDAVNRNKWPAQVTLQNVEWSKTQYISNNDFIALESPGPLVVGGKVTVDIEISKVKADERLALRFAGNI